MLQLQDRGLVEQERQTSKEKDMAKKHWTQTARGKAKMAKAQKKAWAARRAKDNGEQPKRKSTKRTINKDSNNGKVEIETLTAYALGKVESLIEGLAIGAGVPSSVLASRVSRLLDSKASREILGFEHHMPSVRGTSRK